MNFITSISIKVLPIINFSTKNRHIQWSLKDLRKVEALESRSDFDLIFDKLYRWEAGSESERENFLNILVKLAHRYLGNEQLAKIEFKGIDDSAAQNHRHSVQPEIDGDDLKIQDYQELSEIEQSDLLELINECEGAIGTCLKPLPQLLQKSSKMEASLQDGLFMLQTYK